MAKLFFQNPRLLLTENVKLVTKLEEKAKSKFKLTNRENYKYLENVTNNIINKKWKHISI